MASSDSSTGNIADELDSLTLVDSVNEVVPSDNIRVDMNGLKLLFHPHYYNMDRADEIYEQLRDLQFNSDEESQVVVYGKKLNIPRKQVAFGDAGLKYKFSGNTVEAKPWPEFLREIRDEMQQYLIDHDLLPPNTKNVLNYVLVNLYRDGHDYIGPHSDDEKDLIDVNGESIVVSLSFGATRDFIFENKQNKTIKYPMSLKHGDLVIMYGETQKKWKHYLPKRLRVIDARYNLTFRFMKNFS